MMIMSLYIILTIFTMYVLFAPREYEVIDGTVRLKAIFSTDELVWIGIGFLLYTLSFYAIYEHNGKLIMKEFSHMPIIAGPCQVGKRSGERLDLWVEDTDPVYLLPEEEQTLIINFIKKAGANLKEFDNYKKLQELLNKAEKRRQLPFEIEDNTEEEIENDEEEYEDEN